MGRQHKHAEEIKAIKRYFDVSDLTSCTVKEANLTRSLSHSLYSRHICFTLMPFRVGDVYLSSVFFF